MTSRSGIIRRGFREGPALHVTRIASCGKCSKRSGRAILHAVHVRRGREPRDDRLPFRTPGRLHVRSRRPPALGLFIGNELRHFGRIPSVRAARLLHLRQWSDPRDDIRSALPDDREQAVQPAEHDRAIHLQLRFRREHHRHPGRDRRKLQPHVRLRRPESPRHRQHRHFALGDRQLRLRRDGKSDNAEPRHTAATRPRRPVNPGTSPPRFPAGASGHAGRSVRFTATGSLVRSAARWG